MRDNVTSKFKELTASGSTTISLTPGSAAVPGKFETSGVRAREANGFKNYVIRDWLDMTIVADPDAAGSATAWDKLYKGVQSVEKVSKDLGTIFSHQHTRGAVLGHIIGPVALGYNYPQAARTMIPLDVTTDVTLQLTYCLPMAINSFAKPIETSQWAGFFDNGTIEVMIAPSTVYNGDYDGLVTKAPCTLRAVTEYVSSPDDFLGVPVQYQDREITGGGDSPLLRQVGTQTGWQGVRPGCGLFMLVWLTNAAGIGLGGPDGVDNITQIEVPFLGQESLKNLDVYYHALRATTGKFGPRAGLGTVLSTDGSGWPTTMNATTQPDGRPSANAEQMFLPIIMPGKEVETSKIPRVQGDIQINFAHTTAVSSPHRFVTGELMEFTEEQAVALATKAGFGGSASRKELRQSDVIDSGKLRYTRIMY